MPSEKERESVGGVQDALQDAERGRLGVLEPPLCGGGAHESLRLVNRLPQSDRCEGP